jgi:NAD(P)-dependent dehydrogenase (short-subunit alcohol dehydrogenase family)
MSRVAIVTGSARGIGKGYATALAAQDHQVVIADLNEAGAKATADELVAAGRSAIAVQVDVADPDSVGAMVAAATAEFGTVDVLVNNAALFGADVEFNPTGWDPIEGSMEQYRRAMSVNVDSIVHCSRAVAPVMRANGWGRIVNQASAAVYYDTGNLYSFTKLGVVGLTRMYARALASSGVTVNAIAPGMAVTEAILNRFADAEQAETYVSNFTAANVPLGRPAQLEELANALLFLVSDAASYITAQTISVDGGWVNRI